MNVIKLSWKKISLKMVLFRFNFLYITISSSCNLLKLSWRCYKIVKRRFYCSNVEKRICMNSLLIKSVGKCQVHLSNRARQPLTFVYERKKHFTILGTFVQQMVERTLAEFIRMKSKKILIEFNKREGCWQSKFREALV